MAISRRFQPRGGVRHDGGGSAVGSCSTALW